MSPGQMVTGEVRNFPCESAINEGRFVAIYTIHNEALAMCEVEIFGGFIIKNILLTYF